MLKTGTFIITAALALTAFAAPADARVRHVQATAQTQHGTFLGQSTVSRQPGLRTRDATITGPNGGQSSVYDQRAWGGGTYSHDRDRTFANGDTRSVDTDATRTAPGEWSYERDVTGRNGETHSQTGTVTVTHTP